MLEIKDLKASTGETPILNGLSLSVKPGEVHAIMGPNGSGKSTLAQVIAGHEDYVVTGGSVTYKGKDLLGLEPEERAREAEMRAEATALETATARLRRPSLTHQLIQNILHCQSTRRNYPLRARRIPLRHLHDQTLIRRASGGGLNWPAIGDRFVRGGLGRALRIHLALAERYLGRPRPGGFRLSPQDRAAKAWFLGGTVRG